MRRLLPVFITSLFLTVAGFASSFDPLIVKANFVLKFIPYIEFSSRPGTYKIGYLGKKEKFEKFSQVFQGKSHNEASFELIKLKKDESFSELHIIYIEPEYFPSNLKAGKSLVISDEENGIEKGANINFLTEGDSISFEINFHRSQSQGIGISSRLLNLAKRVIK